MSRLKKYSFTEENAEATASAIVTKSSIFAHHPLRWRAEQSERLRAPIWKRREEWGYGK